MKEGTWLQCERAVNMVVVQPGFGTGSEGTILQGNCEGGSIPIQR